MRLEQCPGLAASSPHPSKGEEAGRVVGWWQMRQNNLLFPGSLEGKFCFADAQ